MRRVIDDSHYEEVSNMIDDVLQSIDRKDVSRYDWGTTRSQCRLIMQKIIEGVPNIKFGKDCNTTGIGNNNCYEIIYTGDDKEEQICGLIHLTDNMFGRHLCWVSDYDRGRRTEVIKI